MNILILDRAYRAKKHDKRLTQLYREQLQNLGHLVKSVRRLNDLVKEGDDLSNYSLVITHPFQYDVSTLREAVEKREDLYVIVHTIDSDKYADLFVRDSDQICSFFSISPEKFMKFLQKNYL